MKRISILDEYDIASILNLKEKIHELKTTGLPFVFRGHVFAFSDEGELLINDKGQGIRFSTPDEGLIKFIIGYVVVAESV